MIVKHIIQRDFNEIFIEFLVTWKGRNRVDAIRRLFGRESIFEPVQFSRVDVRNLRQEM